MYCRKEWNTPCSWVSQWHSIVLGKLYAEAMIILSRKGLRERRGSSGKTDPKALSNVEICL